VGNGRQRLITLGSVLNSKARTHSKGEVVLTEGLQGWWRRGGEVNEAGTAVVRLEAGAAERVHRSLARAAPGFRASASLA
jgi:hypothetical protein